MEPAFTEEIEQVLVRYVELQAQERAIQEEKSNLQKKLKEHIAPTGATVWFVEVSGEAMKVTCKTRTIVEYDEASLRERLGERYIGLLSPDPGKIRRHMDEIAPYLEPVIEKVGSTDPEKVKAAIEAGSVSPEEFRGAYTKTDRSMVAVARAKRQRSDSV